MKYTMLVTNIKWDIEDEDVDLPSSLTVDIHADEDAPYEDINNMAADAATDKEGYCILSCNVSKVT